MHKSANHQEVIKTVIVSTLMVVLIFVIGVSFVLKKDHENMLSRDLQINSLIDEVGDLKGRNDTLQDMYSESNSELKNFYGQMSVLNKNLSEGLAAKNNEINNAQEKLTALEKDLKEKITEKENTISELSGKYTDLKNEQQIPALSDSVTSFLIVGQNRGLTDSIIVASSNPANRTVSLVNIPRDLFYKGRKINEIYSQYGVEKLNEAVADITGINSQKYAIFDFNAFVDVIDGIGGIDINVEHDLKDNQYPGPGFSYTLVSFKKGLQHMNGSTALKFVRSRESTTDFDRSARQQLVISAIKQKLNTLDLLSSLPTFISLYEKIMSQIKTDVGIFEAFAYYDAYKSYEVKTGNILSSSNYLYSKISTKGQYILLPNGGNYSKIKKYVLGLVNG